MEKPQLEPKTVRLRPDIVKKIEDRAKVENRNFSNMVDTILLEAMKHNLV